MLPGLAEEPVAQPRSAHDLEHLTGPVAPLGPPSFRDAGYHGLGILPNHAAREVRYRIGPGLEPDALGQFHELLERGVASDPALHEFEHLTSRGDRVPGRVVHEAGTGNDGLDQRDREEDAVANRHHLTPLGNSIPPLDQILVAHKQPQRRLYKMAHDLLGIAPAHHEVRDRREWRRHAGVFLVAQLTCKRGHLIYKRGRARDAPAGQGRQKLGRLPHGVLGDQRHGLHRAARDRHNQGLAVRVRHADELPHERPVAHGRGRVPGVPLHQVGNVHVLGQERVVVRGRLIDVVMAAVELPVQLAGGPFLERIPLHGPVEQLDRAQVLFGQGLAGLSRVHSLAVQAAPDVRVRVHHGEPGFLEFLAHCGLDSVERGGTGYQLRNPVVGELDLGLQCRHVVGASRDLREQQQGLFPRDHALEPGDRLQLRQPFLLEPVNLCHRRALGVRRAVLDRPDPVVALDALLGQELDLQVGRLGQVAAHDRVHHGILGGAEVGVAVPAHRTDGLRHAVGRGTGFLGLEAVAEVVGNVPHALQHFLKRGVTEEPAHRLEQLEPVQFGLGAVLLQLGRRRQLARLPRVQELGEGQPVARHARQDIATQSQMGPVLLEQAEHMSLVLRVRAAGRFLGPQVVVDVELGATGRGFENAAQGPAEHFGFDGLVLGELLQLLHPLHVPDVPVPPEQLQDVGGLVARAPHVRLGLELLLDQVPVHDLGPDVQGAHGRKGPGEHVRRAAAEHVHLLGRRGVRREPLGVHFRVPGVDILEFAPQSQ